MKKILAYIIAGIVFVGVSYVILNRQRSENSISPNEQAAETAGPTKTAAKRPMLGEKSFGLSVCDEVSKSLVEKAIGKPVEETEDKSSDTGTGCTYYTNKAKLEHILIQVSYLSAENQKKGQEILGRTITTNKDIPMENFIVLQEDGQINAIYLVMAPEKFVRVDRTTNVANEEQLIELAKQISKVIIGI